MTKRKIIILKFLYSVFGISFIVIFKLIYLYLEKSYVELVWTGVGVLTLARKCQYPISLYKVEASTSGVLMMLKYLQVCLVKQENSKICYSYVGQ